jgi:hypothetical protein
VAWVSTAPVGSQTAAVWVSRWVSTPNDELDMAF